MAAPSFLPAAPCFGDTNIINALFREEFLSFENWGLMPRKFHSIILIFLDIWGTKDENQGALQHQEGIQVLREGTCYTFNGGRESAAGEEGGVGKLRMELNGERLCSQLPRPAHQGRHSGRLRQGIEAGQCQARTADSGASFSALAR